MKRLAMILLLLNTRAAGQAIQFETSVPADSEMVHELVIAFKEAFARKNLSFVAVEFPSKRGLEELKSGRVDGTMGRFGDLSSVPRLQNIVRIDYPLVFLTISMWCSRNLDRSKPSITLGLRLGNTIMAMLASTLDKKRVAVMELNSYGSAVQMLKAGRLDCMLGNAALMESQHVDSQQLEGFPRHDLITAASYPWISSRHADLKGFLERELKAHPFPEAWRRKFRLEQPVCQGRFDQLCPDGVVFTQAVHFKGEP